jgi:hypothetical protein
MCFITVYVKGPKDMPEEIIKSHCKVVIKIKSTESKLDSPNKV